MNPNLNQLLELSPAQLRRAAELKEQIAQLGHELYQLGQSAGRPTVYATQDKRGKWKRTPQHNHKMSRIIRRAKQKSPKPHWTQRPENRARVLAQMRKATRERFSK